MIIVSLIRSNCDLMICHRLVLLFENRDEFKRQTLGSKYPGYLYSDFPTSLSSVPYFFPFAESQSESAETGPHLVVCVHGLDGEKKSGAALVVCGEKGWCLVADGEKKIVLVVIGEKKMVVLLFL